MVIAQFKVIEENAGKMTTNEIAEKVGLAYQTVYQAQKYYKLPIKKEHVRFEGQVKAAVQLRVLTMAAMICERPHTVYSIANALDTTMRTVYRYLTLLKALGVEIHQNDKRMYSVSTCPFCKKKL